MSGTRAGRLLIVAVLGLAGCAGYGTYEPAKHSERDIYEWPYDPASDDVMIEALAYVITNFPPGTPESAPANGEFAFSRGEERVAISLLPGMKRKNYQRVVQKSDPLAVPFSPDAVTLPRYLVGRIEMQGLAAWVDVHRPIEPGPDGLPRYQCLTVRLHSQPGRWVVQDYAVFAPGIVRLPRPQFIPEDGVTATAEATEPQS